MAEFQLETARLILRDWREADSAPNWAMHQDLEVMRYLLPIASREESDEKIGVCRAHQAEHGHCFWAVERKSDGALIGTCGIVAPRAPLTEYEIGWRFARDTWGQGYATEAAAATLAWGWANLPVESVVAITTHANTASRRVMERLGMVHAEGEDFDHPRVPEDSPLRAHVLYRIHRPQ